jgi:hypothetical protein
MEVMDSLTFHEARYAATPLIFITAVRSWAPWGWDCAQKISASICLNSCESCGLPHPVSGSIAFNLDLLGRLLSNLRP